MFETLRSKKIATLATVTALGVVGCGGSKAPEVPSKSSAPKAPTSRVAKSPQNPQSAAKPVGQINTATNLCENNGIDSEIKDFVETPVNCYNITNGPGSFDYWLSDGYTPSDLPVEGAIQATILLSSDGSNEHDKAYKLALQQGGKPVDVEPGWLCSYSAAGLNLTCYNGEEVVGVGLNQSAGAYESYAEVMRMALEAAAS
jgi:hypothetical protein